MIREYKEIIYGSMKEVINSILSDCKEECIKVADDLLSKYTNIKSGNILAIYLGTDDTNKLDIVKTYILFDGTYYKNFKYLVKEHIKGRNNRFIEIYEGEDYTDAGCTVYNYILNRFNTKKDKEKIINIFGTDEFFKLYHKKFALFACAEYDNIDFKESITGLLQSCGNKTSEVDFNTLNYIEKTSFSGEVYRIFNNYTYNNTLIIGYNDIEKEIKFINFDNNIINDMGTIIVVIGYLYHRYITGGLDHKYLKYLIGEFNEVSVDGLLNRSVK